MKAGFSPMAHFSSKVDSAAAKGETTARAARPKNVDSFIVQGLAVWFSDDLTVVGSIGECVCIYGVGIETSFCGDVLSWSIFEIVSKAD